MRVLILAEVCNPDWPSLPIFGYEFARAIANHFDVVVATQIRNKPNIEREKLGNAKVVYLDTESIAAPLNKFATFLRGGASTGWTISTAFSYFSYLAFEWAVWQHFQEDLENGRFDVIHRITPVSPTQPSPLAKWSSVPFLLGPVNGGLPWPKHFNTELNREREWLSYFRNIYKLLPYYHSTYTYSTGILASFEHTIADLPVGARAKAINFSELGFNPSLFSLPVRPKRSQMTILFVGRLVPYKLPEVVIRAFAASSILRQHRLLVVGEGPERPRLEQIIQEQDLGECIELAGHKSQAEVGELMRQAEIFAFPSIREVGGGVVVEAMACGMVCVVVDYGGPGSLVQKGCGIKISLGDLNHLVKEFQANLEQLVTTPDLVESLGTAAYHHAITNYSWDAKAQMLSEVYNWATGRQEVKPDFSIQQEATYLLAEPYC